MSTDLGERVVEKFERGRLSRRQLAARLMGLGAAMAVGHSTQSSEAAASDQDPENTFAATGLDHVALNVSDLARSRDFYVKHLGLKVLREGRKHCFLGDDKEGFFLALFEGEPSGLNHYCYAIRSYDPDQAARRLEAAGLKPRRENGRVYFDDPDGIEVQVTGA